MSHELIALLFIASAVGVWLLVRRAKASKKPLRVALATLEAKHDYYRSGFSLHRNFDGYVVRLELLAAKDGDENVNLAVEFNRPRDLSGLTLVFSRPGLLSKADPQIGDTAFDRAVQIEGDLGLGLALIDDDTRAPFEAAIRAGWTFRSTSGAGWYLMNPPPQYDALLAAIDRGAELALLTRAAFQQLAPRLARAAAQSPTPEQRVAALRMLIRYFRATPEAEQALELGAFDTAPELRFVVASDRKDLAILAAIIKADSAPLDLRRQAFNVLVAEPRAPETHATLAWLCANPTPLGDLVVRALHVVEHPDAHSLWCQMVGDAHATDVRAAAIDTLARLGTTDAIPVLSPLGDKVFAFGPTNVRLHQAARSALAAIRARRDPRGQGGLALAEAQGGELTVADTSVA